MSNSETNSDTETTDKWYVNLDLWLGLGVFLTLALIIITSYLGTASDNRVRVEKVRACSHATDVTACIKVVN